MCDFGLISGGLAAGAGLWQGLSGFFAGNANAASAKVEGEAAWRSALSGAGQVGRQASADLGRNRAEAAASGFTGDSASEALTAKASAYGLDIDAILYGGKSAKESAKFTAKLERQRAFGSLAGGVMSAAGTAMQVFNPWSNPAQAGNGMYGQAGRYGTSRPMVGSTGRLIGGV